MQQISLVIVDDHPLFRQGVRDALSLESDFQFLGDAGDGVEALDLIRNLTPAAAVLDVNLPSLNGYQITRQVLLEKIPTKIILVTAYDDPEQIIHAMRAGANAYCAKNIHPSALAQVIRNVVEGQFVINEEVFNETGLEKWLKEQGVDSVDLYGDETASHPLSGREMEVLGLIAQGLSNKEIARMLGISNQTIKNHVTAILRKIGVEDRTQAAIFALRKGWVRPPK
jgi:DNA-binding NarL/FixJ family response regulator